MIRCPFLDYGIGSCVYRQGDLCEDIEVCHGNSDSVCGEAVEKEVERIEES